MIKSVSMDSLPGVWFRLGRPGKDNKNLRKKNTQKNSAVHGNQLTPTRQTIISKNFVEMCDLLHTDKVLYMC